MTTMTRKISVLLLHLLLLCCASRAEQVSRQDALDYAAMFFGGAQEQQLSVAWIGQDTAAPAYWVINNSRGGFVIVAGDDAVQPLLGYSLDGSFATGDMPDNLRSWFGSMERDITVVRSLHLSQDAATKARWHTAPQITKADAAALLETAEWGQDYPYNKLCLIPGDKTAATGCVATAMAIVLRYNQYPARGSGILPSYTTSSEKYLISGYSIDDHVYDYSSMPQRNTRKASDAEQYQIAQLIHDCGVMVEMDYTASASGAMGERMPVELAAHMGYSAAAEYCPKAKYSPDEWLSILKEEISAGRPLLYCGQDASGQGGHAYVVDGYDNNGLLHINWGWEGSANGYYSLEMSVGEYRFSESQAAVIGLVPDPDGSAVSSPDLLITSDGLSLKSGKIGKGQSFTLTLNTLSNYGMGSYKGVLKAVLTNGTGEIKEEISSPVSVEVAGSQGKGTPSIKVSDIPCTITSDIAFTDKVTVLLRDNTTQEYVPLRGDSEAGSVVSLATVPSLIAGRASYSAGEEFVFELFSSGEKYSISEWYFDGVKTTASSVTLSAGVHEVKFVGKKSDTTETIVRELTVR